MDYTLAQMRQFLAAVARHEAESELRTLAAVTTAVRGDAQQIEHLYRDLARRSTQCPPNQPSW